MNLLTDPWIPVRRADDPPERIEPHWIAPHQITERVNPPVCLAAPRPDFNGALMQFLIGLVQTTTKIDSDSDWHEALHEPPSPDELRQQFSVNKEFQSAFELMGEKKRFMQDNSVERKKANAIAIEELFLDGAKENTRKNNRDLFVKRDSITALCPRCVAAALFTLQTNAPSGGGGGGGHFVSMRGGGPLTTLVVAGGAMPEDDSGQRRLWRAVWLNVLTKTNFESIPGNKECTELRYTFPWLADIESVRKQGIKLQTEKAHPAHVFWGMPRRIWLDYSNLAKGACGVCGIASEELVSEYFAQTVGIQYGDTWRHPLSPCHSKKGHVHPQPDGFAYRHWLAWVMGIESEDGDIAAAKVITRYLRDVDEGGQFRLWAFGYDTGKAEARCWYEGTLPLYSFADVKEEERKTVEEVVQSGVGQCVAAAEEVKDVLLLAVRHAWFGDKYPPRSSVVKKRAIARKELHAVSAAFWSDSSSVFYELVHTWIKLACTGKHTPQDSRALREGWLKTLKALARNLFAERAVSDVGQATDPERIARAYLMLVEGLKSDELLQKIGFAAAPTQSNSGQPSRGRANKPARAGKPHATHGKSGRKKAVSNSAAQARSQQELPP